MCVGTMTLHVNGLAVLRWCKCVAKPPFLRCHSLPQLLLLLEGLAAV